MVFKKSPGGSLFPYPYKNGELYGLHLGSFGDDEAALIARMQAEAVFFEEQKRSLGIWMDFYQTRISDRVIGELIEFLRKTRSHTVKLGLVGCSAADRRRINRQIRNAGELATLPVRYFSDPEEAKTWLVSERLPENPLQTPY
jgi:hypothetical protein